MPRYLGVEEKLRNRIRSGTYRLGASLPSELDLAQEFDVSRFTVREALRRLSEAGLISRQQGARSKVSGSGSIASYTFAVGSDEDLQQYAHDTYFDIQTVTHIQANVSLARFLRCREKKRWLLLSGVRREAHTTQVLGVTEVYLWEEFESHLGSITARGRTIHRQISEHLGVRATQIRQEISALSMPDVAAVSLGVEPGAPALEIVRRYSGTRGRAFEVARNLHVAGSFVYTQDFQLREVVDDR